MSPPTAPYFSKHEKFGYRVKVPGSWEGTAEDGRVQRGTEDLTGERVEVRRFNGTTSRVKLTKRLFAATEGKPALYTFEDPNVRRREERRSKAEGWVAPPDELDDEFVQSLLEAHPFEEDAVRYDVAEREGEDGLSYEATIYWGKDPEHVSVVERSETFVAEYKPRSPRGSNGVFVAPGSRVYLWRSQTLCSRGYDSGERVSINGFASAGRQAVHWRSDEDAQREVAAVRNEDGTVLRAADDPDYAGAGERYSEMMSR